MHRYGVRIQNDLILTIDMTTSWTVVIYRCVTQVSEADETQQNKSCMYDTPTGFFSGCFCRHFCKQL